MYKKIIISLLTICVSLSGCGGRTNEVQNTSQDIVSNEVEAQSEVVEKVEQEAIIPETEEEVDVMDNVGYMYEVGKGEKTIKFNIPKGYYYDKSNSMDKINISFNFGNDKISIGYAVSCGYMESVLNYLNNGEWNETHFADEKEMVTQEKEIDTEYGKVVLLTVVQENKETSKYQWEYAYFTYNNEEWIISRSTLKDNKRNFEEIIDEMFTKQTIEEQNEESKSYEIQQEQYDYIVSAITHENGYSEIVSVVGVNIPEKCVFERCGTVYFDDAEYTREVYFKNETESVRVSIEDVGGYLEAFCDTGLYEEGVEIEPFCNGNAKLLEKKETVDTSLGQVPIVYGKYEYEMLDGSVAIGSGEWAVLKVNGYTVIVRYYYSSDIEYQGKLVEIISEIFEAKK